MPPSPAPEPSPPPQPEWLLAAGWYLAAALGIWSFGFTIMRGSDLWWHIAGGRWMTQHATLWVPDPYSFTSAGHRWINDAWLSDILLFKWVEALGLETLVYWKWGLIVATWLLLFRLLCRLGVDRLSAYVVTLFGLAIAAPFLDVRPQLYSFLLWVVVLDATLGRERPPRWLPLVFLLWVNLHASFLLGILSLPMVLLPFVLTPARRVEAIVIGVICIAACLLNPNGPEVVLRPLRYFIDPASPFRSLGEWLPPFVPGGIQSPLYPYGIAASAAGMIALAADRGARRSPNCWAIVGLAVMTLVMSLKSRRFVPMFGIADSLILGAAARSWLSRSASRIPAPAAILAAMALALIWLAPYPRDTRAFHYLTADYEFPAETMNFADVNELSGNAFAYYNWGGFIHLRSDGRLKVFVDGRSETVYSDETFLRYMAVLQQKAGWIDVVERSGADFFLWPSSQPALAAELVKTGRWGVLYNDHASILLARQGAKVPEPLRETPPSPVRSLKLSSDALRAGDTATALRLAEEALAIEPDLQPACINGFQARLLSGDVSAARAMFDRCQDRFPDPSRDALLLGALRKLESGTAARR